MADQPIMQVRYSAACVRGEQEWQDGVNEASEACFDQRTAERRGDAEVFNVRFADGRRVLIEVFQ